MGKVSMLDQIQVRVICINCGPVEIPVGKLRGQTIHRCARCGNSLKTHLSCTAHLAVTHRRTVVRAGHAG